MAFRQSPGEQDLQTVQGYLNGQPDILTAIVKHRTKTPGNLGDIYIQQFDPKGHFVTLQYRPPPARSASNEIKLDLKFDPPLKSVFEVRPTLRAWQNAAMSYYKVPQFPKIDYYVRPALFPFTLPAIIGLCILFTALWVPGHYADLLRATILEYGGKNLLPAAAWCAFGLHMIIEPCYMLYLTAKHKIPPIPRLKWILTTMCIGFGAINEFRDCVQYERLRHIYKQTDVGDIGPRVTTANIKSTDEKKTQ